MNLLAVSNDVFALMFGGVGLLASSLVAFLTFQKGAGGKQSLEADTPVVLSVKQSSSQEMPSKHAA